ncbi:hypothetical protein DAPPUDRAFT_243888 [Daphnia pulex]|uniref:Uncharacterized protein n=1 Tax=Daphnia pulex TaxID=6669 RepID=E9GJR6_DAPPU|nr:hypothetical protein DAPPUDRAFT_243888 [Daphnia pulex]|eukprot:EFX80269.1 hypothetical protein DAPPUDRAFT_243888 [Daphnia pulex]
MVNTVVATETGAANSLLPTINNVIESSTTLSALKRSVAGLNAAPGEELTPSLLRAGLNRCIKMAQNSAFAREINALAKSKQIGRDSPSIHNANSLHFLIQTVCCEWEDACNMPL